MNTGDLAHVNVNNPAFAYAGLEEDGDNDGFFEETKVPFLFHIAYYSVFYLIRYIFYELH